MKHGLIKTALFTAAGAALVKVSKKSMELRKANSDIYHPSEDFFVDGKLNNKKIAFLGSSVTYGLAANGISFVDFLRVEHGVDAIKEAVSGTTLADLDDSSYVSRLRKHLDTKQPLDLFACQLSTNDQRKGAKMGFISRSYDMDDFDTSTSLGAIEYIIAYVQKHWDCPIVFYTCLRSPNPAYEFLRKQLFELQYKWHFAIIDIWNNANLAKLNQQHPEFMLDDTHPTCAGYRYGWTPIFVRELDSMLDDD